MMQGTIKSGVIGWPIDHSLSPRLHNFWLKKHNINGSYRAVSVKPDDLSAMIKSLFNDGYSGLNVTVPHKEAVMPQLDEITNQARRIGAVNTIIADDKGRLVGSNTDGFGFIENLKS